MSIEELKRRCKISQSVIDVMKGDGLPGRPAGEGPVIHVRYDVISPAGLLTNPRERYIIYKSVYPWLTFV